MMLFPGSMIFLAIGIVGFVVVLVRSHKTMTTQAATEPDEIARAA